MNNVNISTHNFFFLSSIFYFNYIKTSFLFKIYIVLTQYSFYFKLFNNNYISVSSKMITLKLNIFLNANN